MMIRTNEWRVTNHSLPTVLFPGSKGSKGYPPDCPDYDFEKSMCDYRDNADTCGLHTACKPACVPKYCKLPDDNPHKIHGYADADGRGGDQYVKLGSVCGYFHYVEGQPKPRHDVEVCCKVKDGSKWAEPPDMYDAQCAGCYECDYPQKVNDACCKFAYYGRNDEEEDMGRDGEYKHYCPPDEVCCKCGSGYGEDSYKCIHKHEKCIRCD